MTYVLSLKNWKSLPGHLNLIKSSLSPRRTGPRADVALFCFPGCSGARGQVTEANVTYTAPTKLIHASFKFILRHIQEIFSGTVSGYTPQHSVVPSVPMLGNLQGAVSSLGAVARAVLSSGLKYDFPVRKFLNFVSRHPEKLGSFENSFFFSFPFFSSPSPSFLPSFRPACLPFGFFNIFV